MVKNVLITGGCGFVGSHLVRRLVKDFEVVVLDTLSSRGEGEHCGCRGGVRLIVGENQKRSKQPKKT